MTGIASGRRVVLIVDDEPGIREVRRLLVEAHCDVLEAAGGAQALEIVRARRVDLVLLDVTMPGMDGLTVLQRLRRQAPGVKVVLLTAIDSARAAVTALKLGAFDCLTKPFVGEDVLKTLRQALPGSEAGAREECPDTVRVIGHDVGWRASIAALIAAHGEARAVSCSFDLAADYAEIHSVLTVIDVIGAGARAGYLIRAARQVAGGPFISWVDEDCSFESAGGPTALAVIAGRRRVAALSARISRVVTPTRPARERFGAPTIRALQCISGPTPTPSVESVAAVVGLSARHLTRLFRQDTGLSLKSYLLRRRVELAKERLRATDAKVDVVAEEVGLYDASHMARLFRRIEGMTPAAYRQLASREMSETS